MSSITRPVQTPFGAVASLRVIRRLNQPLGLLLRQAVLLKTRTVQIKPIWSHSLPQPIGSYSRQIFQSATQRFPYTLQPVQLTCRCQNVRRIDALLPTGFEPAPRLELLKHIIQQFAFHTALNQPITILAQYRSIKTRIRQLHAQGVFQINTTSHRLRNLPICQSFCVLDDQHQIQSSGCFGRSTLGGKQWRKITILIQHAQLISHPHVHIAFGKSFAGYSRCFFRHQNELLGEQGHGMAPFLLPMTWLLFSWAGLYSATQFQFCHSWRVDRCFANIASFSNQYFTSSIIHLAIYIL